MMPGRVQSSQRLAPLRRRKRLQEKRPREESPGPGFLPASRKLFSGLDVKLELDHTALRPERADEKRAETQCPRQHGAEWILLYCECLGGRGRSEVHPE